MNPTFTITVMAGFDGGRIVYESVIDEFGAHDSRLVFGGNADEASKYVAERISKMAEEPPRQVEAPKARRRKDTPEWKEVPKSSIDDLELLEGEAD
jgi:hypothetical protein